MKFQILSTLALALLSTVQPAVSIENLRSAVSNGDKAELEEDHQPIMAIMKGAVGVLEGSSFIKKKGDNDKPNRKGNDNDDDKKNNNKDKNRKGNDDDDDKKNTNKKRKGNDDDDDDKNKNNKKRKGNDDDDDDDKKKKKSRKNRKNCRRSSRGTCGRRMKKRDRSYCKDWAKTCARRKVKKSDRKECKELGFRRCNLEDEVDVAES